MNFSIKIKILDKSSIHIQYRRQDKKIAIAIRPKTTNKFHKKLTESILHPNIKQLEQLFEAINYSDKLFLD